MTDANSTVIVNAAASAAVSIFRHGHRDREFSGCARWATSHSAAPKARPTKARQEARRMALYWTIAPTDATGIAARRSGRDASW